MLEAELKKQVYGLWQRFYSNNMANTFKVVEQMSYLIFFMQLEVTDNEKADKAKRNGEKYTSIFKDHEDCKWSHFKQLPGEEMLKHVRDGKTC